MTLLDRFELLLRKTSVKIRLILAFTLILAAVAGVMGIYATQVMQEKITFTAQEKLKSDLTTGEHIVNMKHYFL